MLDWRRLVPLSDAQLAAHDLAAVNLACAAGLPDAGSIDVADCRNRLDHYARCVAHYTDSRLDEFRRAPQVYKHSEPRFRVVCLVRLLRQQFGIHYNPAKIPADAPFDTADSFVHGALTGPGGTCATLPVVYAAVGRRLGYPLKLVTALRHLFTRWDDGRDRFNIEANDHSINDPPDDHYRRGIFAATPGQEREWCLLRSLTPRQELAFFLSQRACRRADRGDYGHAARSFAWASLVHPENRLHACGVVNVLAGWRPRVQRRIPPVRPELTIRYPPRVFANMPDDLERELVHTDVVERLVSDPELMAALRRPLVGGWPAGAPRRVCVEYPEQGLWDI